MGKPEVGNAFAKASHTRFCIFPHNLAPDFLQYISENPNDKSLGRRSGFRKTITTERKLVL